MQQGANSATMPPKNAVIREMPAIRFIIVIVMPLSQWFANDTQRTLALTDTSTSGFFGSLVENRIWRETGPETGMIFGR